MLKPFHLALPVKDLEKAKFFYLEVLGLKSGRTDARWIDLNFFGHQLSLHLVDEISREDFNEVDGDQVPVRHFGLVMDWEDWHDFKERIEKKQLSFLLKPKIRFKGEKGEQATFFLRDPSGNALEFKSFKDPGRLFAN